MQTNLSNKAETFFTGLLEKLVWYLLAQIQVLSSIILL
jgi:hypothetical protein